MFRNLPPLTKVLLVIFTATFLLEWLLPSLTGWVVLMPAETTIGYLELWRIITYPLVVMRFWALLSVGMILFYFLPELETVVHQPLLISSIVGITVANALLFMLLFPDSFLGGPQFIGIFVLVGTSYLWPKRELLLFGMLPVKVWILSAIFVALTLFSPSQAFVTLSTVLLTAAIFHIRFQQYNFGRQFLQRAESKMPNPAAKKQETDWSSKINVQRRIDEILDKISRKGIDSLTNDEREFLREHSR